MGEILEYASLNLVAFIVPKQSDLPCHIDGCLRQSICAAFGLSKGPPYSHSMQILLPMCALKLPSDSLLFCFSTHTAEGIGYNNFGIGDMGRPKMRRVLQILSSQPG